MVARASRPRYIDIALMMGTQNKSIFPFTVAAVPAGSASEFLPLKLSGSSERHTAMCRNRQVIKKLFGRHPTRQTRHEGRLCARFHLKKPQSL